MHLSALTKYAVKLSFMQTGVQTASNAGERMVVPTALILAGFGLGLSSFSMKKMACTPSRRSSLLRML
ncbi:uncharacterized protein LOC117645847 [Thrips palmi]|uniref:Uncharacterized protein LOC117645847 n=1 Tax=Thrips palmi TaxID=161013 RepID=A0A6P8YQD7_THRPL|nr:uncharacterized protein LOC117645847 [Thrips palmi]XP_034242203.1 uncharacterized protein LOC117645847 [Thrips palmi]